MTLLRIDSSIQGPNSASTQLADQVVAEFTAAKPGVDIVSRHLAQQPLPSEAWPNAIGAAYTPEDQRSPEGLAALAIAAELADELRGADHAVMALPLYNWGVSQHVKTWIDLAIAGGTAPGEKLLEGTPTVLLTTRGGAYGPGTPKEGWDHNIGYISRILGEVWGAELTVIEREFTLAGVNPAMDAFLDVAAQVKQDAEEAAVKAGRALAS
ncbi:FMN-dependent NADH-azoreductase [Glycomyces buryatensis]|uniref:FMN dependent NADH:quinone oxidoreductase n=1 Tax=Glycomyces buryatensis TaxID=2570927 RepID=A0A4S8Q7R3_9ACTN|nr:NAD(P)H-dependent oxidoreductase [Glycomyces buryatensis]THV40180.1 flavodoxin family protein [Glycomyces buryatensis]